MRTQTLFLTLLASLALQAGAADTNRTMRFSATNERDAIRWQTRAREELFALMMGGAKLCAAQFFIFAQS